MQNFGGSVRSRLTALAALAVAVLPSCSDDHSHNHCEDGRVDEECPAPHTLFVASEGSLSSFDITTREARAGSVTNIVGPVDMHALADGTVMVNLTGRNEVLAINGTTMLEVGRVRSSNVGGTRPVHSYISPTRSGKTYWLALNDGESGTPATNSAAFIDISPGSSSRFQLAGEVALGIGHHKASFSKATSRVVVSNIADCNNALSVYDYSNLGSIQALATFTGAQAGFDAPDPGAGNFNPSFCDPTYQRGLPPAPHGCATSPTRGKAYCNMTSSGDMVVIDIDAATPTFTRLPTNGKGGGFTLAHPGGRYLYTMQEEPREGAGGVNCQIGQIAVTDSMSDTVVARVPVRYRGPSCADALTGTPAETANPGHVYFSHDGNTLFVPTSGGFMVADARVNQVVVLNTSNPASPVQLESITVGTHTGHSASALSGDGKWLFVVHTIDGTVSQIDTATRAVVATFSVGANPKVVATFGTVEGPSEQTGPVE